MKINWVVMALLCGCGGQNGSWRTKEIFESDCGLLGSDADRQGPLEDSDSNLDVALSGPGFFVLKDKSRYAFTRRGTFYVNAEGFLVRDEFRVQVFQGDASSLSDLKVAKVILSPKQDGFDFGKLSALGVRSGGNIEASYSNGVRRQIARIPVAVFARPQALRRGREHFVFETPESGRPLIGMSGGLLAGEVWSGALEQLPDVPCGQTSE